ncbi:MAG: anti sigma factor C-terminal domain-containing protein [Actinomycetota bacterium]|nr:anti sigma factor C-terminal domain-containing protein [Actinomycetota bacterium]
MEKEQENKSENKDKNEQNNNNEKDVDKIFDEFKDKKLGSAVKRARWQTILRNVGISLLVFLVLFAAYAAVSSIKINFVDKWMMETVSYTEKINDISAPDKYIGKEIQVMRSAPYENEFYYNTYKLIEGKVVYTGEEELIFYFRPDHTLIVESCPPILEYKNLEAFNIEYFGCRRYNELGQRVMVFFYPFLKYDDDKYLNDLNILDDIGNDKYLEMALSFDREYTLEEVENMLPEDITVTWYWVDDLNEDEKELSKLSSDEQGEMEIPVTVQAARSEYTAYGIKLYYNSGEEIPDPVEWFIYYIVNYKDEFNKGNEFERIYNNLAGDDGKLTEDDIRIFGAVVTGDPESLKPLVGMPFIKASSLGVVTDKY